MFIRKVRQRGLGVSGRSVCLAICGAVTLLVGLSSVVSAGEEPGVYERVVRSTVWIVTEKGEGSGAVVKSQDGDSVVVTTFHVVQDAERIVCFFPSFDEQGEVNSDRQFYLKHAERLGIPTRIGDIDPERDLAILELDAVPEDARPLKLASRVLPGEEIHVIGNYGWGPLFGYSCGHVRGVLAPRDARERGKSGLGLASSAEMPMPLNGRVLVTDAPVNEGDSGGPVVRQRPGGEIELVGLAQSYSTGRLITNAVHASELASLLRGDNKSFDKRLRQELVAMGFKPKLDPAGLFLVETDGRTVVIPGVLPAEKSGTFGIWSPVAVITPRNSRAMAELMREKNALEGGRLEVRPTSEGYVLAYSRNLSTDLRGDSLRTAIDETAAGCRQSAERLQEHLNKSE
ncbi:MAG: trypsin-like peptidase domain-containing protein [Planctomycetia bacterium]|nr:trypsin-like peptidase domain-containing protein [Planctomycetia bacterium]